MEAWINAGITEYSYQISYFRHGCEIVKANVTVELTTVSHRLRKNTDKLCAQKWTGDTDTLLNRKISDLHAEIVSLRFDDILDYERTVEVFFDSELGYPH
ncbi:MAG: hypothetical protein AAFQ16_09140, partial [Pseudomonadota bacterium]